MAHMPLFKLVHEERCDFVRIARQFRARGLRVEAGTHRILQMDALQRIRVLLVPSLAALLHHGVAILLGAEDGRSLGCADLALRHEFRSHLYGNAMDWWVRRRTHACLLYAGDIFLVVHGDLTVASDADLGRRLGDHKGA